MHTKDLIVALFAATASAMPFAQNGRWMPEYEARSNTPTSSASPPPAAATGPSLGPANRATNPPGNLILSRDLLTAPLASQRQQILQFAFGNGTTSPKFDLTPAANPGTPGQGGEVIVANSFNYPQLTGLGIAGGAAWFAPCGLNPPHTHPRATEFFTVATAGKFTTGFVYENAFTAEVTAELEQWQAVAFPMGSIHWQQNQECTEQVAIVGFSGEDPGASTIANNFIVNTNADIVQASLGQNIQITGANFASLEKSIPRPFALGMKSCLDRCGIKY